jgi:dephospho-CoA kinase
MKLIGIGGTNGAGKDVLSDLLADEYGWLFISASRDLIIPELKKRGLPLERQNMAAISTEWRRQDRDGVISKAVDKFNQENKGDKYKGMVISALRHPWEADAVHRLGGKVVWVDADPKIRYDRIFNRGQGDKDNKTFEQFLAEEEAERDHGEDKANLSWQAVKDRADYFIDNDTDSLGEFKKKVEKQLKPLL